MSAAPYVCQPDHPGPPGQHVGHRLICLAVGLTIGLALALGAVILPIGDRAQASGASGPGYCPLPVELAPTRPPLHLNRTEGPAGTNLQLSGSGWSAGAHLTIHADKQDPATGRYHVVVSTFGTATVGADGSITTALLAAPGVVCVDPTGAFADPSLGAAGSTLALVAVADRGGAVSAPVLFHFLAGPVVVTTGIDPHFRDVKQAATIGMSGSGWEAGAQIRIILAAPKLQPDGDFTLPIVSPLPHAVTIPAIADEQGSFTAAYPIAMTLPWGDQSWLTIEGTGPRFGTLTIHVELFLLPAVPPTFVLDRTEVIPGSSITISGEHWNPGQTLTLEYCRGGAIGQGTAQHPWPGCLPNTVQPLGTAMVDTTGHFRQTVQVPPDARAGTITVQADAPLSERVGWHGVVVSVVGELPQTWETTHPRLALLLTAGLVALAAILLPLGLGTGVGVYRRRHRARAKLIVR